MIGALAIAGLDTSHISNFFACTFCGIVWTMSIIVLSTYTGHVYAAGAFFAIVQDYRVMRTEKGWYCLPEIFIKRKFSPGLVETLK